MSNHHMSISVAGSCSNWYYQLEQEEIRALLEPLPYCEKIEILA